MIALALLAAASPDGGGPTMQTEMNSRAQNHREVDAPVSGQ